MYQPLRFSYKQSPAFLVHTLLKQAFHPLLQMHSLWLQVQSYSGYLLIPVKMVFYFLYMLLHNPYQTLQKKLSDSRGSSNKYHNLFLQNLSSNHLFHDHRLPELMSLTDALHRTYMLPEQPDPMLLYH